MALVGRVKLQNASMETEVVGLIYCNAIFEQ